MPAETDGGAKPRELLMKAVLAYGWAPNAARLITQELDCKLDHGKWIHLNEPDVLDREA
jgi:hypothetical protein